MRYSQDGPAVAEHQARVRGIIRPRPPLLVPLDAAEGRVLAADVTAVCPLPAFADAVIPVESTNGGLRNVSVTAFPAPGSNIRRRGEDIQPGASALEAGTVLGPAQFGLLSAPGTVPGTAQVRDANSIMLAAAVRACGAVVQRSHVVIHPGSHAARAPAGRGSVLRHPGRRAAGQPGERLHLVRGLPAPRAARRHGIRPAGAPDRDTQAGQPRRFLRGGASVPARRPWSGGHVRASVRSPDVFLSAAARSPWLLEIAPGITHLPAGASCTVRSLN